MAGECLKPKTFTVDIAAIILYAATSFHPDHFGQGTFRGTICGTPTVVMIEVQDVGRLNRPMVPPTLSVRVSLGNPRNWRMR